LAALQTNKQTNKQKEEERKKEMKEFGLFAGRLRAIN